MSQLKLRRLFCSTLYNIFLERLSGLYKNQRVVALDYHYFTDSDIAHPGLEVSYSVLDKQLEILSDYFEPSDTVSTLESVKDNNLTNQKSSVLISIDDADQSINIALESFIKYNIPVVLFAPIGLNLELDSLDGLRSRILCRYKELEKTKIIGSCLDKSSFFNQIMNSSSSELIEIEHKIGPPNKYNNITSARKFLSLEELGILAKNPLITIASHSMSHNILSALPENWLHWEIKQSQHYISEIGGDSSLFAYPFGFKNSYNNEVKLLLSKYGVKFAFSTSANFIDQNSDMLALGRSSMLNFHSKSFVSGSACGAFHYWDSILRR